MSDYISKSALLEQLIGIDDEIVKGCIGVIQTQPTVDEKEIIRKAFERVVKRLEKLSNEKTEIWSEIRRADNSRCYGFYVLGIDESIEIVKEEGGIE